ncbi:DUF2804 family protein [Pseudoduganella sp. FT93W]|uniref:DUF2804 family protein n=1 Tax=Duganella fentianensis TaxID=2692177 RepID=A0A845HWE2_9BURK|nr:DUF2804 domain-containing protein [Duganella fentianensis]MYN45333.1 DUF2804 family protein [Duganella fentianensis]
MKQTTLSAAPPRLPGTDGQPIFGRFAGQTGAIDWRQLAPPYARSRLWRRFHHKRWHYVALYTEQVFCAVAIVDVGWTNTAFAYAFERQSGRMLAEFSQDGLPGCTASLPHRPTGVSQFRLLGKQIHINTADQGTSSLTLRCGEFAIDASFGPAPAPLLLAAGPVADGAVHATQKSGGMPLQGQLRVGGRTLALDGGIASFDYSNGLLARNTAWRWASAHDLSMGFNLQAGYFGAQENALWLDGRLYPLGAARFEYDRNDSRAPWQISTDDGLLELSFMPEGERRGDKNLLVAASRYVQPIGTFSGWVRSAPDQPRRAVQQLAGVTEDHASRW